MNIHFRPNGRPVHPECNAKPYDETTMCSCSLLWEYWDGTARSLDSRIESLVKQDLHRRADMSTRDQFAVEADQTDQLVSSGFWSQAEFLKSFQTLAK